MTAGAVTLADVVKATPYRLALSIEIGPPLLAPPIFAAGAPWLRGLSRALASVCLPAGHEDVIVRVTLKSPAESCDGLFRPAAWDDRFIESVVVALSDAGWTSTPGRIAVREEAGARAAPVLEVAIYARSEHVAVPSFDV